MYPRGEVNIRSGKGDTPRPIDLTPAGGFREVAGRARSRELRIGPAEIPVISRRNEQRIPAA